MSTTYKEWREKYTSPQTQTEISDFQKFKNKYAGIAEAGGQAAAKTAGDILTGGLAGLGAYDRVMSKPADTLIQGGLLAGLPKTMPTGSLTAADVMGGKGAPQPFTGGTMEQVVDRKIGKLKQERQTLLNADLPSSDAGALAAANRIGQIEDEIGDLEVERDRLTNEKDMAEVMTWTQEERESLQRYFQSGRASEISESLKKRYSQERMEELAESYQRYYNQEKAGQISQQGRELGQELGFLGVVPQVGIGLLNTAADLLGITGGSTKSTGRYMAPDPYRSGRRGSIYAQGIGQGAAEKAPEQLVNLLELAGQAANPYAEPGSTANYRPQIYESTRGTEAGEVIDTIGSGAYQVVNTAADSLARAYLGGAIFGPGTTAAKAFSLGLAGVRSFDDTFNSTLANGNSVKKAAILGVFDAGTEIATEYIPLDEWWKIAEGGSESVGAMLRAAARQGAIEMTQEEIGFLATAMAEYAVLREKSEYQILKKELIDSGMSPEDAERAMWEEFGRQAAGVAVTSFFSGGLSEAGAEAYASLYPGTKSDTTEAAPDQTRQTTVETAPETTGKESVPQSETVSPEQTPVEKAQEYYRQNGTVTNSMAEAILADEESVGKLREQTPLKLDGTKSQNRAEIKAAVARITPGAQLSQDGGVELITNAMTDLEGLRETAPQTERATPEQAGHAGMTEDAKRLWTTDRSESGWGSLTDNSVWATALAVKETNPELFDLYEKAGQSATTSPVIDAVIAASQDVRQGTISPMAAAQILDREFRQNGVQGLGQLYSDGTGNLRGDVLEQMKGTSEQTADLGGAVGAAGTGFTPKMAAINEYGAIPEGENPVRADQLPVSTDGTDRVSRSARTALEAEVTPDEFVPLIENNTMRGGFSFIPITNSETVQGAVDTITADGWTQALANWTTQVRRGVTSADITAMGALLYNNAVNRGDFRLAMNILLDYQQAVRNSAQALQAARILKTLSPSDRLYGIRRSIQRMVEDLGTNREITINEDLARQYQEAQTNEEADEILDRIVADVARQLPPTLGERITALRYLNMLGNFRTQVRNFSGNVAAQLTYMAKDEVAAAIEAMASLVSGGAIQRTKSFITDRDTRRAARADFENVADWIAGGGRYNDRGGESNDFARRVQEQRRMLPPGLEQYRRATDWAMNNQYFGDAFFGREAYARALAGYLNARGIRTDNLESVDRNVLNGAREYAVRQAQEATFRDNNAVSDFVARAARGRDTPWAVRVFGEAVMPFRKTPANVLVRAEEFSPLGLINSTVNTVRAARGDISGAELVDSWAKTFTGTALFAIGWALANSGILRGGPDDDEEKAEMDEMTGRQDYAITLPDGTNFTIDFLTPSAIPMFLGAQLEKVLEDDELTWEDLDDVFMSLAEPMIEMSMLQGVNDLLDAGRYADNSLLQTLAEASVNYLTQALGNTLLGQIERATERNRMTTYVDKDSPIPPWLQRSLGKLSQKIPVWDFQQTEYINAMGETEENPKGALNAIYQLFSPAYFDKAKDTPLTEEIYRLNEAQSDVNVVPQKPSDTLTYTGKDGTKHEKYQLSMEEYDTLQRVQGQTSMDLLDEVISSDAYWALNDRQKAELVGSIYEYAREAARDEAIGDYVPEYSEWMKDLQQNGVDALFARTAKQELSGAFSDLTEAKTPEDRAAAISQMEEAKLVYDGLGKAQKDQFLADNSGRVANYIRAAEVGVSAETFAGIYEQYRAISESKTMSKKDQGKAWAAYLNRLEENGTISKKQMDQVRDDLIIWQQFPVNTDKFDGMVEAGANTTEALNLLEGIDRLTPYEGNTEVSDAQKWEYIAGAGLNDSETDAIMKLYMTDYNPNAKSPDRTELKYDAVRSMGYSPEEFVEMYIIYTGTSGKWNKTAALRKAFPGANATKLYEIFSGGYFKD